MYCKKIVSAHTKGMKILSESTRTISARPAVVFEAWADPTTWPTWDPEVKRVQWDGEAAPGTRGKLWPKAGPPVAFAFTELIADQRVVNESRLLGGRVVFHHEVIETEGGVRATVTVGIAGPLAPFWAVLLRKPIATAAPSSLDRLARYLEGHP